MVKKEKTVPDVDLTADDDDETEHSGKSNVPRTVPPRRSPSEIARDPAIISNNYKYAPFWLMHTTNRTWG